MISDGGEVPRRAWMSVAAVTARPATWALVGRVESLMVPTSKPAESLVGLAPVRRLVVALVV
jgi:RES domain-containing protein